MDYRSKIRLVFPGQQAEEVLHLVSSAIVGQKAVRLLSQAIKAVKDREAFVACYKRKRRMSDTVILRKVYAVNSNTGTFLSTNQLLNPDGKGGTTWMPIISSLTVAGGPIVGDLPSTLSTTSSLVYSSLTQISSLWSTTNALSTALYSLSPGNVDPADLVSTVNGLGNAGYISSSSLSNALTSTVTGLGNVTYISSASLTSTVTGLGTIGYVSTSWINSTIAGLGSVYISSQSLASSLTSSVNALGTVGYISTSWLTSTVNGLGSIGYVSTASLDSTTTSLLTRPVNFNSVSDVTINAASTVVISSATNVYYTSSFYMALSSFYNSTITVTGSVQSNIGATIASSSNMVFSTAVFNLSNISPLLGSNSRVTVEFQPTFIFSAPFTTGVTNPLNLTLTTQVAFGTVANIKTPSTANLLYTFVTSASQSTIFQPYIKFSLPSNIVQTMLSNSNTFLMHQITGGFAAGPYTGGFATSNFTVLCPTSSIMLSLQNQLT